MKPFDSLVSASTSCLQFSHHGSAERWADMVSPTSITNTSPSRPGTYSPSPSRPGTTSRALRRVSLHKRVPFLREAAEDASSGRGYTGAPRSGGDSLGGDVEELDLLDAFSGLSIMVNVRLCAYDANIVLVHSVTSFRTSFDSTSGAPDRWILDLVC